MSDKGNDKQVMNPAIDQSDPWIAPDITQVVVFRIGGQLYALPLQAVQEIQQIVEFTAVPGGSTGLVGMIDLRGDIVPLVDMRTLLGLEPVGYGLETPLVFCRAHSRLVALAVDAVEDVLVLEAGVLQAPSKLQALSDRMHGVGRLEDGLLFVLDPERLVPDVVLPDVDSAMDESAEEKR